MDDFLDYKNNEWWWWNCIIQTTSAIINSPETADDFVIEFIRFYDAHSLPPSARRGKRRVTLIYDAYEKSPPWPGDS